MMMMMMVKSLCSQSDDDDGDDDDAADDGQVTVQPISLKYNATPNQFSLRCAI